MKHLKSYENLNETQIGDYVIASYVYEKYSVDPELSYFLSKNIGQFVAYDPAFSNYVIKYENVPKNLKDSFGYHLGERNIIRNATGFNIKGILFFSKNKEDLVPFLTANKYNL